MWWTSRRGFFGSCGAGLAALVVPRTFWDRFRGPALDPVALGAVADVALPSTPQGLADAVVDEFLEWLDGYRPGAERPHGYGSRSMEIRYLPPDPRPRWDEQLRGLDVVARERSGSTFAQLGREDRRSLLREELDRHPPDLSSPLDAEHVGAALMAFYLGSSAATDRAYGARIGRWTCRSLSTVAEKPPALEGAVR